MTWLSWEKMCAPKKDGGLGFRNLKAFNIALLAKQGRRLQSNTRSLVHRVLKACYFPDCDFIDAELGQTPSYAWRSIMVAQDVVRDGHQWQVGDGTSIQIWRDNGCQSPLLSKSSLCQTPYPRLQLFLSSLMKLKESGMLIWLSMFSYLMMLTPFLASHVVASATETA